MQKITPFLWFDTQAEEAADFYVSVFGKDSRIIERVPYGEAGPGSKGTVMTVEFELRGQQFLALNGGKQPFQFNESFSLMVHCETQAEQDHFWEKLSEGGEKGPCGWLKDRYGFSWQVVPVGLRDVFADPDPARVRRAMEAMMKMSKLDLPAMLRAADGR